MKILFQGDSITDAFRKPEEINPAYQLGNGYVFLVAARLGARYPGRQWEFVNRGVSGHAVQNLAERWQADALDVHPDLLSLLTGVNNIVRRSKGQPEIPDAEILRLYRGLLDQMRAQNPKVRFLLLEPFLLRAGTVTEEMTAWLRPVQKGIAAIAHDFDAPLVPLQGIFDRALSRAAAAYWAYDGIHPTHAGFQLIADAWLRTAEKEHLLAAQRGTTPEPGVIPETP
ncbi:MAG: SGNH/GDSL hydrolase family protein [Verrucomicrobiota bacterium]